MWPRGWLVSAIGWLIRPESLVPSPDGLGPIARLTTEDEAWSGPTEDQGPRTKSSAHDGVDDLGQLAPGLREGIEIMLARAPGLDQTAMTQEGQMVADGGLALGTEIGA